MINLAEKNPIKTLFSDKSRASHAFLTFLFFAIVLCLFVLLPFVRQAVISAGSLLKAAPLNETVWNERICSASLVFLKRLVCFLLAFIWMSVFPGKTKKSDLILWIFFGLYLFFTLITVINHEPWDDEVIAWRLSKKNFSDFLYAMRFEGHFWLWYLILAPFSKSGVPLLALGLISWGINAFAVAVFIRKSDFHPAAKILTLCTNVFLFWYPVVSRPYVIIPAVLFLIASIYKERNEKTILFAVLIAVLTHTHTYIEGMVGILSLLFFIEDVVIPWKSYSKTQKKEHVLALVIIFFGVLSAFLELLPAFMYSPLLDSQTSVMPKMHGVMGFFQKIPVCCRPFFLISLIAVDLYFFMKSRKSFIVFTVSVLYMLAFAFFVFNACVPNRAFLWFVVLLFSLWLAEGMSVRIKSFLLVLFALFVINPKENISDWTQLFDSDKAVAQYIRANYPEGTKVYTQNSYYLNGFECRALVLVTDHELEYEGKPVLLILNEGDYIQRGVLDRLNACSLNGFNVKIVNEVESIIKTKTVLYEIEEKK